MSQWCPYFKSFTVTLKHTYEAAGLSASKDDNDDDDDDEKEDDAHDHAHIDAGETGLTDVFCKQQPHK
jgi:hypothetical protein